MISDTDAIFIAKCDYALGLFKNGTFITVHLSFYQNPITKVDWDCFENECIEDFGYNLDEYYIGIIPKSEIERVKMIVINSEDAVGSKYD